jgi:hypothetical protein
MTVFAGVPTRDSVSLTFECVDGDAVGTVISARNNRLSQVFRGQGAEALRRAERAASEMGFDGCYDIEGVDELAERGIRGLQGMFPEVRRQLGELSPKAVRWGDLRWSPEEMARVPAIQAHVGRLTRIQKILMKQVAERNFAAL